MNYNKHYYKLCYSRQKLNRSREDGRYYESHHIKPKSLGGGENQNNKVLLTPKEHFIAHLLLYYIYKEVGGDSLRKMAFALVSFKTTNLNKNLKRVDIKGSRSYEVFREAAIAASKGRKVVDTTNYRKPKSAKHKQAIKEARLKAQPRSNDTRKKMRQSALKRGDNFVDNHIIVHCPHCSKKGQKTAMKRWHFNNCKTLKTKQNA